MFTEICCAEQTEANIAVEIMNAARGTKLEIVICGCDEDPDGIDPFRIQ